MHNDSEETIALPSSPVAFQLSECSESGVTGWVSEYVELRKSCVTLLTRKDKQGNRSFVQLSDAVACTA